MKLVMMTVFNFPGDKIINQSRWWFVCFDFQDFIPYWSFADSRAFPTLITHQNIVTAKHYMSQRCSWLWCIAQNIHSQQNIRFIAIYCPLIQLLKATKPVYYWAEQLSQIIIAVLSATSSTSKSMVFMAILLLFNKAL